MCIVCFTEDIYSINNEKLSVRFMHDATLLLYLLARVAPHCGEAR